MQDADVMCALEKLCFSLPWTLEQCKGALQQEFFSAFGLLREAELIAYVSFFHGGGELEILNLAVHPGQRRKGYGARTLDLLLQAAAKMSIQKAVLEVRESNFPAIALYEKAGFRQAGIRPRYYPDNGENALIYICDLTSRLAACAAKDATCKK